MADENNFVYLASVDTSRPRPKIVSFSELYKWDSCKRQWYYRFGLGLKPLEEAEALNTGTKGHKLLQFFYTAIQQGKTKEEAMKITHDAAAKAIKANQLPDVELIKAWTMVDNYIREMKEVPNAVLVENRFLIPVAELTSHPALKDVLIGFTPDVVLMHSGGFVEVEDAKFVQRAWAQTKIETFMQAKLYQIFLKKMGYNVTRSSIRFFNLATGKIHHQPYILEADEEKVLIEDFTDGVYDLLRFKNQPEHTYKFARRTTNYGTCQFCSFSHPCGLERKGKDASKTLANLYIKSDYDYNS